MVWVRGKLLAYLPDNRRSRLPNAGDDKESLVVRTDVAERAALLAKDGSGMSSNADFRSAFWTLSLV